ncbi:MAG: ankyrin repeat domain-containing protein [Holosporaceae bacterium]|nr:ankyrin repeat domain-containing protein [Holosporaceae bacterium]
MKKSRCKILLIAFFVLLTIGQSSSTLKLKDWVSLLRDVEVVEFPKDCLKDVNARDVFGNTLLHTAASLGNIYFADFLVKGLHADVNVRNDTLSTPLHLAVWLENVSMVDFFVNECRAKINVRNDTLSTPLHWAVWLENMSIVEILANDRESLSALDINGKTPLDLAVYSENQDIIRLLTEKIAEKASNKPILLKFTKTGSLQKTKKT